jgi:hypothetical protein
MEMVHGMDNAVATKAVRELINKVVEHAQAARSLNLLVKEIEDHGQD